MKTIAGRLAEPRAYLLYCLALFHPGVEVPVFESPRVFTTDLTGLPAPALTLIIEEGRRHLDRQHTELDRIRTRASTLLTVALAALAAVAGTAHAVRHGPTPALVSWAFGAVLIVSALAGSAAVLTTQARLGVVHAAGFAAADPDAVLLARTYAEQVPIGDATLAARVTVLRDATLLLVLGALGLAVGWYFRS